MTPEEARERLWSIVLESSYRLRPDDLRQDPLDAVLATLEAFAVLVDWPKLLEAGDRAGKLKGFDWWYRHARDGAVWCNHEATEYCLVEHDTTIRAWRLTEPS